MQILPDDEKWMQLALKYAKRAAQQNEVPVGAVLVRDNELIAYGYNKRESWHTPIAHAEIICIHRASQKMESWRLLNSTLYVTLEPCVMCTGALIQARVSRLVFGAKDPKGGAVNSLYEIPADKRLNHRVEVTAGVLEEECSDILKKFFKSKR